MNPFNPKDVKLAGAAVAASVPSAAGASAAANSTAHPPAAVANNHAAAASTCPTADDNSVPGIRLNQDDDESCVDVRQCILSYTCRLSDALMRLASFKLMLVIDLTAGTYALVCASQLAASCAICG